MAWLHSLLWSYVETGNAMISAATLGDTTCDKHVDAPVLAVVVGSLQG